MPWHSESDHPDCADDSPWAVVNDDDDTVEGCHPDEDAANAQIAALYAAEEEAKVSTDHRPEKDSVLRAIYESFAPKITTLPTEADPGFVADMPIEAYSQGRWEGPLAVEGVETGDSIRREFGPDSLTWRDPPLPLYWQEVTADEHSNSFVVGRIDTLRREGDQIIGEGVFNMDESEDGVRAHRLVHGGFLRGLSVSLDDVTPNDYEEIYPEAAAEGGGDDLSDLFLLPEKVLFHHGRISDVLLTGQPAFQEAHLRLIPDRVEAPVAASGRRLRIVTPNTVTAVNTTNNTSTVTWSTPLVAAGGPAYPPKDWFADPKLSAPTPLTVTPDGRIFGHLAQFGVCHMSFTDRCVRPPVNDDFRYFNMKALPTREGDYVNVGNLTLDGDHAPLDLGMVPAKQHYENTSRVVADVHAGSDRFGIWVAGAARPELSPAQMRAFHGASVSGDWRWREGKQWLVHGLLVNVAGFPIPRLRTYVHNGQQTALVASGVVTARSAERFAMRQVNDRIARTIGRDHPTRRADAFRRVHPDRLPST